MQDMWIQPLGPAEPLEEEMETHSSVLAWKIPWTEEPGRLQSMGSQRVRHDWVTEDAHMQIFTGCRGGGPVKTRRIMENNSVLLQA